MDKEKQGTACKGGKGSAVSCLAFSYTKNLGDFPYTIY